MSSELPSAGESRIPLHAEELSVSRRQAAGATLRVSTVTREHEHLVDEMLTHQRVEIERIPIDRQVEGITARSTGGDTTVLSVVEETYSERRSSNSAPAYFAAPPGSCGSDTAGSSDHPRRAQQG
jgi:hypothetical protein